MEANLPTESIFGFDWRYLELFLIAILLTSLTVITHYTFVNWIGTYFNKFWANKNSIRSRKLVMVGIVGILMTAHFVEVWIWALFSVLRGVIPSFMEAMYFSIASYTTLGESGISLPRHWQGLGGFEAMNAILMFGWSTAVLAAVVVKMHDLGD